VTDPASGACRRCGSRLATSRNDLCPRCLFEGADDRPLLGGYLDLEEEIGRGGMGTVYRAQDRRLGRTVAVKLLHADLASDAAVRTRFAREARALAGLKHAHIVTVHDVGEDEGTPFIVLELVEGGSLAHHVPCELARALELAIEVASALAYAHAQGVVHRDVKPGNVLVDESGHAKVADFGIARSLRPDARGWTVTRLDEAVGTPDYMAPEVLAGAPPDPRADLYALGVLLHELSTGKLPRGAFEPAPEPVGSIVRRALAPDPEKRTATARELLEELERARDALRLVAKAETGALPVEPRASVAPPAADLRAPPSAAVLPPDEAHWRGATALVLVIATGALWYFIIASVQPKTQDPKDVLPLLALGIEHLPSGEIFTRARFEVAPAVVAVAAWVVALAATALLRGHWRRAGLEVETPDRPVREARGTVLWGALAVAVFAARKAAEATHSPLAAASAYVPIVGAAIEVGALFTFFTSLLEAARTGRPLGRERLLWVGILLAVSPPICDLIFFRILGGGS
jgi:serine/threonine-protein kinase